MTDIQEADVELVPVDSTEEVKRTRFTGEINIDFGSEETEEVDTTTSGLGRGRPALDYSPYVEAVQKNAKANVRTTEKNRVFRVFRDQTPESITTIKSRFNEGAKQAGKGLTWATVEQDNGLVTVKFAAGKRLEGRGRKPGHNGQAS